MKIKRIKNILSLVALVNIGFAFNCAAIILPSEGIQNKESRLTDTVKGSQVSFMDCEARLYDDKFELKNSKILRRWRIGNGILSPETMIDLENDIIWLSAEPSSNDFDVINKNRTISMRGRSGLNRATEEESLIVEIESTGSDGTLVYNFQIFPDVAAMTNDIGIKGFNGDVAISITPVLERFKLNKKNLKLTSVKLYDRTDARQEVLSEEKIFDLDRNDSLKETGNLFFIENKEEQGFMLIKHAPVPWSRPVKQDCDISWNGDALCLHEPLLNQERRQGYNYAIVMYEGGRSGRISQIQNYQRQLRKYDYQRDGLLLSNTWGDRNQDKRINTSFISKEIEAGSILGVDIIQIDDGWQAGRSANSAFKKGKWEDFWNGDFDFWQADSVKFPNGLKPLVSEMQQKNMQLGLWYAVDSSDDFENWIKDAERVLKIHRELGVNYFKFDAINFTNTIAERNCLSLLKKITEDSEGVITVDLDVTGWDASRPGYLGDSHVGPIFVENRYTDYKNYFPHRTLRNFWGLAQYIDPVRLRMEFLNNERRKDKYVDVPLAPATYSADYLFASVMFASPLAWMEVSELSDAYKKSVTPLIHLWRKHRQAIHSGTIIPLGSLPDGHSWTGFVSVDKAANTGYALIFREENDISEFSVELPLLKKWPQNPVVLYGNGHVKINNNTLTVNIPKAKNFVLVLL